MSNLSQVNERFKGFHIADTRINPGETVSVFFVNPRDLSRTEAIFGVEGECCSHSHFTDPSQFRELAGTEFTSAENRDNRTEQVGKYGDQTIWSFLVFTTSEGHVTIDWRNDNNGYDCGRVTVEIVGDLDIDREE
jgi:hypothetical protein